MEIPSGSNIPDFMKSGMLQARVAAACLEGPEPEEDARKAFAPEKVGRSTTGGNVADSLGRAVDAAAFWC